MDLLTNVGTIASLRHENHLIDSLDDAIAHARSHSGRAQRDIVPDSR
jgi:SulP family sulfate permease